MLVRLVEPTGVLIFLMALGAFLRGAHFKCWVLPSNLIAQRPNFQLDHGRLALTVLKGFHLRSREHHVKSYHQLNVAPLAPLRRDEGIG